VTQRLGLSDAVLADFCVRHHIRRLSLFGSTLNLETAVDRFVWLASNWFADGFEETRDSTAG